MTTETDMKADAIAEAVAKTISDKVASVDDVRSLNERINTLSSKLDEIASVKVKERVLDDPKRGYANASDFFKAVMFCSPGGPGIYKLDEPERERFLKSQILTKGPSNPSGANLEIGPDGGYLIPPEYSNTIIQSVFETNTLLGLFPSLSITGESIEIPAVDETTRTLTSIRGGFGAYRKNEVEQMTGTRARFRTITFTPKEIYAFSYVTDKMLRNLPSYGSFVLQGLAEAIQHRLGDEIFNGTGSGQFLGFNNSSALITQAAEPSQAAGTIVEANLAKMRSRLPASSWSRFVVACNQDVQPALDLMVTVVRNQANTDNVGGFGGRIYSFERDTIFGRPIYRQEYCASLGNAGDIWFIDPNGYQVVTRGTAETASSMHLRFDYAETAFRIILEADARPILNNVLTPLNGLTTLSHFVRLAAR